MSPDQPVRTARGGPQRIPRPPRWRPGRRAPWAHLPAADRSVHLDEIERVLAERGPGRLRLDRPPPTATTRRSAVLVPLYEQHGQTHVVLTRRSPQLRSHTWEVSFPGGRADDGESPWQTALREAHEEIALDPATVRPIGELDRFVTVGSRSLVHPVVGALPERPRLTPEPAEVDQILHVPLAELLADDVFREELWPIGDRERAITFFELHGNTVWGATAAMLRQLLTLALRVEDDVFLG
ncbi:MAG TPA: CoA pyrophosphatase [Acidimicrobiales bacterium]